MLFRSVKLVVDKVKISERNINEVAILLDNDGIDRLCKELQMLKSASVPEHIHLSTPEWAGDGLDSAPIEPGYIRVNQLRIVKAKE